MERVIDRHELADFLRRRRELLRPSDVGLPDGLRRRTPGLRREEVASLAGVSTDHYTRLEQARGSAPSESVLSAIARALQCDLDERDHLFYLAGMTPAPRRAGGYVRPGLIALARRLTDIPVMICTDIGEIAWSNELATALIPPLPQQPGRDRNIYWRWFTKPELRPAPPDDWDRLSANHVMDLRATYARRAGEPDITSLVHDLLGASEEFRGLWERHQVAVRRADVKTFVHPEVGPVSVRCEVLLTEEADVKLLAYFPLEGTDAAEKLELLRVIGTQRLTRADSSPT
ncbi:Helix-turn-helix domain-containing protein [Nocardioides sp. YR527]|uniref:helix-turn-helix transcriptional regulator n=1 Tax=Nocardioides sp. YR527 TaxID=1881028 RepID=UPI00088C90EB|nr:helix-turn-helix transcriptional regulator [Nocardioides sp. YR527]SDK08307.1 Helix-turn-helix domain-containing protein [Nocardioides sp. YR527]